MLILCPLQYCSYKNKTNNKAKEIAKIKNHIVLDVDEIAKEVGSIRTSNIVLLGAAIPFLGISAEKIENGIQNIFGKKGQEIIDLGIQRLDAEINRWVLSMFRAGIDVGNPNYHSASGLSLATVNAALASVRDASRTREVSIVGRIS